MSEESIKVHEGVIGPQRLETAARELYEAWSSPDDDPAKGRQKRLLTALLAAEPEDIQPLFHLLFPKQVYFPHWTVLHMQEQLLELLGLCEQHEPETAVWMVERPWK